MPKISKPIITIKTIFKENGIQPDKGKRTTKKTTAYLLRLFSTIKDERVPAMVDYPLGYILLLAFLAVLGGANSWIEIQDFGNSKKQWLRKFLDVKKYGIPSHDTFCRVFGLLDTKHFESIIVDILEQNINRIKTALHIETNPDEYRLINIDGKEENGTGRRYSAKNAGKVRNIQTLHVYDSSNQICLASEPIEEKSNEIPTAQKILSKMDLKNTICTFDALHMQKLTIGIIRSNSGHYVGGLKGNQQGLMEEAASCFTDAVIQKLRKSHRKNKPVYVIETEHAHGQEEKREYFLVQPPANEERDGKWKDLRSFILCIKTIIPDNPVIESSTESRYYASDLDDLTTISEAIRSHWAVEQFHWQLDVAFREDDNSTMNVNAYENLSRLNKLCLHLLQLMKTANNKISIARMRKRFAWNYEDTLEELLSFFDEEAILQVLENNEQEISDKS